MIFFTPLVPAPTTANPAAAWIGTHDTILLKVVVTIVITALTAPIKFSFPGTSPDVPHCYIYQSLAGRDSMKSRTNDGLRLMYSTTSNAPISAHLISNSCPVLHSFARFRALLKSLILFVSSVQ